MDEERREEEEGVRRGGGGGARSRRDERQNQTMEPLDPMEVQVKASKDILLKD